MGRPRALAPRTHYTGGNGTVSYDPKMEYHRATYGPNKSAVLGLRRQRIAAKMTIESGI